MPGGWPRRVADLPVKHRPVLAQHVSPRFGYQIQTIAKERVSDGAVAIRPVDVRQSLSHPAALPARTRLATSRPSSLRVTKIRCAEYFTAWKKPGMYLGIETRILVQRRRKHKRPEELAGRLARHGRPKAIGICTPPLPEASWRVKNLAARGTQHCPGHGVYGNAVVHEQLKFFPWRKALRADSDVGENDGLLLQQVVQGLARYFRRSTGSLAGR